MKIKLCISVDEKSIDLIEKQIREKKFRNRSHAFEYAIHSLLNEGDDEK
ncbi:MAG: hypothetical protein KC550_00350 [Nanoarchaeota archaeon]|nr:hypothetical protein [Nanoarchaeota archaeon]